MIPTTDLFELLKQILGCDYISDLRVQPYNDRAKLTMAQLDLDSYSTHMLEDIAEYLFFRKARFADITQAKYFFRSDAPAQ